MLFSRTPSGLAAEHLFYSEILVYVEGPTDIPFYDLVLQNYNHRIKATNGKPECEKLAKHLEQGNHPYVVVIDGDYEILVRARSQHRRVVLLHRHSYENYLFEEEPIKRFCQYRVHSEDSLEEALASDKFTEFVEETELKFKELLVLDVAHQRSKTGRETFFRNPDRFFQRDFRDDEIQKQHAAAAQDVQTQSIDEAKTLVEKYLTKHRFVDLLPGHFAFGIMRRLVSNTVGKSIPNDDVRQYLSSVVWQLVKTRDHDSLKRRLRRAVREAQQMLESSSSHTR